MRGLLSFFSTVNQGTKPRTGLFVSSSLPHVTKDIFSRARHDFPEAEFTVLGPNSYRSLFPDHVRFISNEELKANPWHVTRQLRAARPDITVLTLDGHPVFRRPKLWAFLTNYRRLWVYGANGDRTLFQVSASRLLPRQLWQEMRSRRLRVAEAAQSEEVSRERSRGLVEIDDRKSSGNQDRAFGEIMDQAERSARELGPPSCCICGNSGELQDPSHGTNLRESLICPSCGATSRDRMLIYALGMALGNAPPLRDWPARPWFRILETAGYRAHPAFLAEKYDYYNIKYDPQKIAAGADPRQYADVQNLPYPAQFFDCVLSSDVFEYVRLDDAGFREIFRVLKPGGVFVLQVPYGHNVRTRVLVEARGEEDVFLEPPQYHAENTLVYRIYGRDLLDRLHQYGFSVARLRLAVPEHGISEQETFLMCKGTHVEIIST